ncbi:MAG: pyridoxal 5'-phosphate synthase glutaminase subunit PdxT [Acholeplasmataceae bacterium]
MTIGILALQGAFVEHARVLDELGLSHIEIRQKKDFAKPIDGLIIPGGESTAIAKLLHDLDLFLPIKKAIEAGLPTFGTCAGLILLASELEGSETAHFKTLDITVRRNAYGRQIASFMTRAAFNGDPVDMIFIRAPLITSLGPAVRTLAVVDKHPVAVRQNNQLGCSFHPELAKDPSIHRYFIAMVEAHKKKRS